MQLNSLWPFGRKSAAVAGDDGLTDILRKILNGGRTSKSGARVNVETALKVSTVFACLRVISEGVAQVPFKVMQESPSKISRHPERRSAVEHPLFDLLHRAPNDFQTSFEFRETLVMHAALTGTAYAFKNVVTAGLGGPKLLELILLDPSRVTAKQNDDWSITYKVQSKSGEVKEFPQEAIWAVRGPSWSGVVGLDIMKLACEAVGLAISMEESHSKLHAKGVRPSGIYSVEGALPPAQYKELKEWVEKEFAGSDNAGAPMIMDRAAKWVSNSLSGVDAQHLESRNFQVVEMCRYMRTLPLMIGHSDKTQTFASAEQMFLAHVVHTLMPWYERIQQSAEVNLLTKQDRKDGYYIKLVEAGLLRGAMKETAEYLYRMTMAGIMDRNEARGKLDLNPLEGLDDPLTPTNLTNDPSGAPAQPPAGA